MSIPADKAQLTFYEAGEEGRGADGRRERIGEEGEDGKKDRVRVKKRKAGAGPAMGRHPLTKHSAWDMAFTENSQMPWQLIRALNASCINTPYTWSRAYCTQKKNTKTHTHIYLKIDL